MVNTAVPRRWVSGGGNGAAADDLDVLIAAGLARDMIDKTMLASDSARPPAGEIAL